MDILRAQLVGPRDLNFRHTKYRAPESTLRCIALQLAPLLDQNSLHVLGLESTPLLSLFGIYLHRRCRILIVHCMDKGSFTIRLDPYELQDVIVRSGRLEMWQNNRCRPGEHYISGDELHIDLKSFTAFDLITEVNKISDDVPYEVAIENIDNKIIPLIPVYIGYLYNGTLKPIDFSSKSYKKSLRRCGGHRLILFQTLYHSLEIIKYQVSLHDWDIDLRFEDIMTDILKYPINGDTFLDLIFQLINQKFNNEIDMVEVPSTPSPKHSQTEYIIQPVDSQTGVASDANKEICDSNNAIPDDNSDDYLEFLVEEAQSIEDDIRNTKQVEKSIHLPTEVEADQTSKPIIYDSSTEMLGKSTEKQENYDTMQGPGAMCDKSYDLKKGEQPIKDLPYEEQNDNKSGLSDIAQANSQNTTTTLKSDTMKEVDLTCSPTTKNRAKINEKDSSSGSLNVKPISTASILPKKRLMKQITDIIKKKRDLNHISESSSKGITEGHGIKQITKRAEPTASANEQVSIIAKSRTKPSIAESIGLLSDTGEKYQCLGCDQIFGLKSRIEAHVSICLGGTSSYKIVKKRAPLRRGSKQVSFLESSESLDVDEKPSTLLNATAETNGVGFPIQRAPQSQGQESTFIDNSIVSEIHDSAVLQETNNYKKGLKSSIINKREDTVEGPEQEQLTSSLTDHSDDRELERPPRIGTSKENDDLNENDGGSELSQDTFVDASDGTGLILEQRTGMIVRLGVKSLLTDSFM